MASIIEKSCCAIWFGLLEFYKPFASFLLPVRSDNFCAEMHVFTEAPDFANLVEVLPDIRRVAEEPWPVGIQGKWICIGMRRNVTGSTCSKVSLPRYRSPVPIMLTRISVLQPGPTNFLVLLVDDMFHIREGLLDVVRVHNTSDASTNGQDFDLSRIWSMKHDVRYLILASGNLVIAIAIGTSPVGEGVDIWCHEGLSLAPTLVARIRCFRAGNE